MTRMHLLLLALTLGLTGCPLSGDGPIGDDDDSTGDDDDSVGDDDDSVGDDDDATGDDDDSVGDDDDSSGDDDDSTAAPLEGNQAAGTFVGGAASVVAITAYGQNSGNEEPDYVYGDDLTEGCDIEWEPQGTLCDEAPTTDSPDASTKTEPDSGATWVSGNEGTGELMVGVLVIDACSDASCTSVPFDEARVWQMFSDGKTTQIRFSVHPETGSTPPAWDDGGWSTVTGWEAVAAGATDDLGLTVTAPTVIATGAQQARYLRVEAMNDGTLGDEGYIEIRTIKLFDL